MYALKMLVRGCSEKEFGTALQHQCVAFHCCIRHAIGWCKAFGESLPRLGSLIPLISIESGDGENLSSASAHHVCHQAVVGSWAHATLKPRKAREVGVGEPKSIFTIQQEAVARNTKCTFHGTKVPVLQAIAGRQDRSRHIHFTQCRTMIENDTRQRKDDEKEGEK